MNAQSYLIFIALWVVAVLGHGYLRARRGN